ncbi:formyltransferase family protein [Pseudidiomarina sp. CB1]|uniref:formyltransferase family protein n=1 Tax=Pseudidiomarina sp. CB1 TaxID=2972484 RepID=UPI002163E8F8|nr:formyltransferase family protein [Pseudidiomarina sp. CB1]
MKVSILISNPQHPVIPRVRDWQTKMSEWADIDIIHSKSELTHGDILFLVSCSDLIKPKDRENYKHTLVVHASDLPKGRGWSPHIWQIIEGASHITVSLLEADEPVDTGRIWLKKTFKVLPDWLWDEINEALFETEVTLMEEAIKRHGQIVPSMQNDSNSSYYRKRTPQDSTLNIDKTLREQFDLLRVCDPQRYPAIFEIHGKKYKLTVEKVDD